MFQGVLGSWVAPGREACEASCKLKTKEIELCEADHTPPTSRCCSKRTISQSRIVSEGKSPSSVLSAVTPPVPPPTIATRFVGLDCAESRGNCSLLDGTFAAEQKELHSTVRRAVSETNRRCMVNRYYGKRTEEIAVLGYAESRSRPRHSCRIVSHTYVGQPKSIKVGAPGIAPYLNQSRESSTPSESQSVSLWLTSGCSLMPRFPRGYQKYHMRL